jgi:hypothetical protein
MSLFLPAGFGGVSGLLRAFFRGLGLQPCAGGFACVLGAAGGFLGRFDAAEGDGGAVLLCHSDRQHTR